MDNIPSYFSSIQFSNKHEDSKLPHYFVKLTEDQLDKFEVLNSMYLLENYSHLLFFLENQPNSKNLIVPPFDIVIVLLTLATVSNHYKEPVVRGNDPYNVSRQQLSKRALALLRKYLKILKEFDCEIFERYNLELLRCQFFLAIDTLTLRKARTTFERLKRRKTDESVIYTDVTFDIDSEDARVDIIRNPYRSYISALDQKQTVLGNTLLNIKLSQPGEFVNMLLWTLSNSLQKDAALYISSHDIWIPLLEVILDLFGIRHEYFTNNEIKNNINVSEYVQRLSDSPLSIMFKSIDSVRFTDRLCEYIFIKCELKHDTTTYKTFLHPVYYDENTIVKTFIPRTIFSENYKFKKSMALRRKFIGACFRLLIDVPTGRKLVSPRLIADDIIASVVQYLSKFEDIKQFKAFFFTDDLSQELYFIPLLAEMTLLEISKDLVYDNKKGLGLVENMNNTDSFLKIILNIIDAGYFLPPKDHNGEELWSVYSLNMEKSDVCLLILIRYMKYLVDDDVSISVGNTVDIFMKRIKELDKTRSDMNLNIANSIKLNLYDQIKLILEV